jgi:hypothetical protein
MNWGKVLETAIPLFIIAVIGGISKIVYDYRKSIYLWYKRQKLRIAPANFNVALSLDFKESLNSGNYFNEIKRNLLSAIDDSGLFRHIKLVDFSDIKKFEDKKEAETFRENKDIDLIIWGGFSEDSLKLNNEHVSKIRLNFTYGHPDDKNKILGSMILLDISSKIAVKNYWQIVESNSLKDIEIVSNNIFDIATYILGLTLKIYGHIIKSMSLFERLYNNLVARNDDFRKEIIPHLIDCYRLIITEYQMSRKNLEKGKELCNKILNFDKDNLSALSHLALFQYKTNEKEKAEKTVQLLAEKHPKNPVTELDIAFFRILEKKYTSAFKHYNTLTGYEAINFNLQEVIEFLSIEYERQKEPALLYGSGILSMFFGDKNIAKNDLQMFLEKANEQKYKSMYRKAKKLLQELK